VWLALGAAVVITALALALAARVPPPAAAVVADAGLVDDAAVAGAPVDAAPRPAGPRGLVLLFIDTVRPDRLGVYGYARPTSPNLDAFAAGAVVFERAWAQAPNTPRSFPSLLTGRYPSRIAWKKRHTNFADVLPENQTLFEIFRAAGFRVEVVSQHWYFPMAPGLADGVDAWDNRGALRPAEANTASTSPEVVARATARLDALIEGGAPFVLLVHLADPHSRYMPHPEVADFGTSWSDLYDAELRFVDHHLAPLYARLARPERAQDTVVAVFSDHGEAFNEHGLGFHGRTVYEEELRVPLLLRVPGVAPRRVADRVALVDLLPTLAAVFGLAAPQAQGRSLGPALAGEPLPPVPIFLEQLAYPAHPEHVVGVVTPAGRKLIRNVTDGTIELYDLAKDPGERRNLWRAADAAAREDLRLLDEFLAGDPERPR
jgi:arylsulfatase A-like enzyme